MQSGADLPVGEILRGAADPALVASVDDLYAELDAEIAGHSPPCVNRGACCRFGEFGHRLFVTPVELAYFAACADGPVRRPTTRDACPYQVDGKCTARVGRPAGCRIFFCDAQSQRWQGPLTERTLRRLKGLHEELGLPYAYVDWMRALSALGKVDGPMADT